MQLFIGNFIDRWIFNNPYKQYINERPVRFGVFHKKEFLRREFNVIYNVFRAFSTHEKNPRISFNAIARLTTSGMPLTRYLKVDHNMGTDTAKAYLTALNSFKKNTKNTKDITIYDEAIISIKEYVRDRLLGYEVQNKIRSTQYNPIFHQDWYKSTLIVLDLLKFGGINPFTFEPLAPELFDGLKQTGLYQSHHIDAALKHILQFNEIVLYDPVWHGRFNSLSKTSVGIDLQRRMSDAVLELMNKNTNLITETDIRNAFGDLTIFNTKVSEMWINHPNFKTLLANWNINRQLIRKGKFFNFLNVDFTLSDGTNPIIKKYLPLAKQTIGSFLLLMDDYDFSYLFTDADREFIKRYFKI